MLLSIYILLHPVTLVMDNQCCTHLCTFLHDNWFTSLNIQEWLPTIIININKLILTFLFPPQILLIRCPIFERSRSSTHQIRIIFYWHFFSRWKFIFLCLRVPLQRSKSDLESSPGMPVAETFFKASVASP